MRYDSSMYGSGGSNGPYNQINAQSAYFTDTMETPSDPTMVGADAPMSPVESTPVEVRGLMGKPAHWWVTIVVVLGVFIFISRKFGGPEKFGNIRLTLWNGIFATLFYVIVLNFLKVAFSYVKVPGLSELIAAA